MYIRNNREALLGLPFMCPVRWSGPQEDRSSVDINLRVTDPGIGCDDLFKRRDIWVLAKVVDALL